MRFVYVLRACLVGALLVSAVPGYAQQTGEISGKVTDTSGGVLPGVTVEARSACCRPARHHHRRRRRVPAAGAAAGQLHGHVHAVGDAERDAPGAGPARARHRRRRHARLAGAHRERRRDGRPSRSSSATPPSIKSGVSNEQIAALPVGQEYRDLLKLIPGVQYTAGHDARPERRRQRPGQRLPVRRRQRDAAAVRHAVGRAGVARHRAGDDDQGRRARRRLRSLRRLLDRLGQQVGHEPLHGRGQLPARRRRAWRPTSTSGSAVALSSRTAAGSTANVGGPVHPEPACFFYGSVLPAREHAREPREPLRRAARLRAARATRASAS